MDRFRRRWRLPIAVLLRFESGAVVLVDNVDTCIYRLPGQGERRWRPNHTVSTPSSSSLLVTGFVGAFRHFADVVRGGAPCRSDLGSALRTMDMVEQVLAAATPRGALEGDLSEF